MHISQEAHEEGRKKSAVCVQRAVAVDDSIVDIVVPMRSDLGECQSIDEIRGYARGFVRGLKHVSIAGKGVGVVCGVLDAYISGVCSGLGISDWQRGR